VFCRGMDFRSNSSLHQKYFVHIVKFKKSLKGCVPMENSFFLWWVTPLVHFKSSLLTFWPIFDILEFDDATFSCKKLSVWIKFNFRLNSRFWGRIWVQKNFLKKWTKIYCVLRTDTISLGYQFLFEGKKSNFKITYF
jgi:hypothetical protein